MFFSIKTVFLYYAIEKNNIFYTLKNVILKMSKKLIPERIFGEYSTAQKSTVQRLA